MRIHCKVCTDGKHYIEALVETDCIELSDHTISFAARDYIASAKRKIYKVPVNSSGDASELLRQALVSGYLELTRYPGEIQ